MTAPINPNDAPNELVVLFAQKLQGAMSIQLKHGMSGAARTEFVDFANTLFKFTGQHLNNELVLTDGLAPSCGNNPIVELLVETVDNLSASLDSVMVTFGDRMTPEDRLHRNALCAEAVGLVERFRPNSAQDDDGVVLQQIQAG